MVMGSEVMVSSLHWLLHVPGRWDEEKIWAGFWQSQGFPQTSLMVFWKMLLPGEGLVCQPLHLGSVAISKITRNSLSSCGAWM